MVLNDEVCLVGHGGIPLLNEKRGMQIIQPANHLSARYLFYQPQVTSSLLVLSARPGGDTHYRSGSQ